MYKPNSMNSLTNSALVLIPVQKKISGVVKFDYEKVIIDDKIQENPHFFYCSFKSYGGTEVIKNGIITILETAEVVCWYRDDITQHCRIQLINTGMTYEILGVPENIDNKNLFMKFKVQRVGATDV